MTNINASFPERHKGRALGLNAGGGNIGVLRTHRVLCIAVTYAVHLRRAPLDVAHPRAAYARV